MSGAYAMTSGSSAPSAGGLGGALPRAAPFDSPLDTTSFFTSTLFLGTAFFRPVAVWKETCQCHYKFI